MKRRERLRVEPVDFRIETRRLLRRARLNLAVHHSLQGACLGLAPGVLLSAAGGTIALPIPAIILSSIAAAAGIIGGAVVGFARRIDVRRLLIGADKTLGSRELASTAYELAERPRQSIFSNAIEEDAGRVLAAAGPRAVLGPPRLRLLPVVVALAAAVAGLALFPVDWQSIFTPRQAASQELASLGEELEGYARKLESAARERNLERSLELSRSLAQLGQDLQEQRIERDEAMERISNLQRQLQEEYATRLQRMEDSPQARGSGPGERAGSGDDAGKSSPAPLDSSGTQSGVEQGDAQGQEMKDLAEALDFLQEKTGGARAREGLASESTATGEAAGTSGRLDRNLVEGASGEGAEGAEGTEGGSSSAGTTPEQDRKGSPSPIARGQSGEPLRAESKTGEGETRRLLVRALPDWTGSKIPEQQALSDYQKQAESVLAREEIPLKLRELVKGYFAIIGMSAESR